MTPVFATIVRCIVGCNVGAPDGQTLHVLECDADTGAARIVQTVRGAQGTTYFTFDAAGRNLYAEIGETVDGRRRGSLVRFPFADGRLGDMERMAALPCEAPCHVSLSPDGRRLAFAAYSSATAGTLPLDGGALAVVKHPDVGLGPDRRRQEKAHAHCAFFLRDGSALGVIDLGLDKILFYDPATMAPKPELTIRADPGDGPRHAAWSKDGRFLFVVNELGNSVSSFAFDGARFAPVGKWSTIPEGFAGDTKASAIRLTADGSVLMASNRGHDSIAFFRVDRATGRLERANVVKLAGTFPRDFELVPGEKFMVVGHKRSDEVRMYRFDRDACSIAPVGDPMPVWKPLCFVFEPQAGRIQQEKVK